MINALHLLWIIPFAAMFGLFTAVVVMAAKDE